jgi:hypothetical protein
MIIPVQLWTKAQNDNKLILTKKPLIAFKVSSKIDKKCFYKAIKLHALIYFFNQGYFIPKGAERW